MTNNPKLDCPASKNRNSGYPDKIADTINKIAATCKDFYDLNF